MPSVNAPEICGYYEGLPVNLFLFRLVSFSRRLMLFNKIVFKIVLNKIKSAKYDAINIVGQWPWVEIIHNELKDENLTHTFHEVGSHFKGELSTPLMETVIRDKSKVILPSKSTRMVIVYQNIFHLVSSNRLFCIGNLQNLRFNSIMILQYSCFMDLSNHIKG